MIAPTRVNVVRLLHEPPSEREVANAEHLTEGACVTLEFARAPFCTRSPSVALRRQLPPGGSLKLVPLERANTVRPYTG